MLNSYTGVDKTRQDRESLAAAAAATAS